jgi:hypothetical protein
MHPASPMFRAQQGMAECRMNGKSRKAIQLDNGILLSAAALMVSLKDVVSITSP